MDTSRGDALCRDDAVLLIAGNRHVTAYRDPQAGASGYNVQIERSTLADANRRRSEAIFEAIYRDLYATYRHVLSSDSQSDKTPKWMERLQIIDSTTITLFSNLFFKGTGRHPKSDRKKGGTKVHTVIHANEGVPSDIRFTSAATHDSFMLKPSMFRKGDIVAMKRAYIDYEKFQKLSEREVTHVTRMKKGLEYTVLDDVIYQRKKGLMEVRIQTVEFVKRKKSGETIRHEAREQMKQNFPQRYFYGESANAIKIQIWVTLIANLLLMVMRKRLRRPWSFSELMMMVRITITIRRTNSSQRMERKPMP